MVEQDRITTANWDLYDTRHVVYRPALLTPEELELGYWRAYRDFYRWGSIFRGAFAKESWTGRLRHIAYAGGWKRFEPFWDIVIRSKKVTRLMPLLEATLSEFGKRTEVNVPLAQRGEAGTAKCA
jgi:hypothetical protein